MEACCIATIQSQYNHFHLCIEWTEKIASKPHLIIFIQIVEIWFFFCDPFFFTDKSLAFRNKYQIAMYHKNDIFSLNSPRRWTEIMYTIQTDMNDRLQTNTNCIHDSISKYHPLVHTYLSFYRTRFAIPIHTYQWTT